MLSLQAKHLELGDLTRDPSSRIFVTQDDNN